MSLCKASANLQGNMFCISIWAGCEGTACHSGLLPPGCPGKALDVDSSALLSQQEVMLLQALSAMPDITQEVVVERMSLVGVPAEREREQRGHGGLWRKRLRAALHGARHANGAHALAARHHHGHLPGLHAPATRRLIRHRLSSCPV